MCARWIVRRIPVSDLGRAPCGKRADRIIAELANEQSLTDTWHTDNCTGSSACLCVRMWTPRKSALRGAADELCSLGALPVMTRCRLRRLAAIAAQQLLARSLRDYLIFWSDHCGREGPARRREFITLFFATAAWPIGVAGQAGPGSRASATLDLVLEQRTPERTVATTTWAMRRASSHCGAPQRLHQKRARSPRRQKRASLRCRRSATEYALSKATIGIPRSPASGERERIATFQIAFTIRNANTGSVCTTAGLPPLMRKMPPTAWPRISTASPRSEFVNRRRGAGAGHHRALPRHLLGRPLIVGVLRMVSTPAWQPR
jgi:hypothetical protein